MISVFIKEMDFDDFDKIKNILEDEFDDFWNPNILKSEIENPNSKVFVACDDYDEIIGFCVINLNVDFVELVNIVTRKNKRKSGIANFLLLYVIDVCKDYKIPKICLEVNEKNITAKKLYLRNNFKEVGRRKKYYNNEDDAILMDLIV